MSRKIVVLTGGVGGAKMVLGLQRLLPPGSVTAIVNTGDDFSHLGLHVSPDIDTLLYTLSGQANAAQGWGREAESWAFMSALRTIGGEDWFALGDGDLALHVVRTARLGAGHSLSEITADYATRWEIPTRILPMADQSLSTFLETEEGELAFQDYFVRRRCEPVVRRVFFRTKEDLTPAPCVLEALEAEQTCAIIIAPSNPFLSIDPILAVPGIADALRRATAPVIAVSPIIAGNAVKGPTTKLMAELGIEASPAAIVSHYHGLLDGLVVDERDGAITLDIPSIQCDTLMHSIEDKVRVATAALALAEQIR